MIPVATFCTNLTGVLVSCLCLGVAASKQEKDGPRKVFPPHASLAAYPQALISLKDPKTGMIFYVESNGRRLVAFDKDGAMAWSVEVLAEAKIKPVVGEPVVRHLSLHDGELWATCGKHDRAKIEIKTGKTEYMGSN
jgi:hypothetical protein